MSIRNIAFACAAWTLAWPSLATADEPQPPKAPAAAAKPPQPTDYADAIARCRHELERPEDGHSNTHHDAATELSQCYEATGDLVRALEYARLTVDRYHYHAWCGNDDTPDMAKVRLAQLLAKVGKTPEAMEILDPILRGIDSMDLGGRATGAAAMLVVDIYRDLGELDKAEAKLDEYAQARAKARRAKGLDAARDPRREPWRAAAARQYLLELQLAERGDAAALWRLLETVRESALQTDFDPAKFDEDSRAHTIRVANLLKSMGDRAKPVLRQAMLSNSKKRGWAVVLLAKMNDAEAGRFAKKKLDLFGKAAASKTAVWQSEGSDLIREDWFYALALLGDKASLADLQRYADHPNEDFARGAKKVIAKLSARDAEPPLAP